MKHDKFPRQPERSSYDYLPCLCVSDYWFSSKSITRYRHPICTTHLVTKKKNYDTLINSKNSTTLNSFNNFYDTPFIQKITTGLKSFKHFYDTPFIQNNSTCRRTHLSRRRQYRYMFRHKTFHINWHI